MNDKIYDDLKLLILELKDTKNDDVCLAIEEAVNYSSTATEILMKSRYCLSRINHEMLDDNLSLRIEELKNKLDILLR